jgi:hypothetical protein
MAAFGARGTWRGGAEVVVTARTAAAAEAKATTQSKGARKEQPPQAHIDHGVQEETRPDQPAGERHFILGMPKMLGGTSMAQ